VETALKENTVPTTEVVPELRGQLREYLQRQGYKVTEDASILGKSGINHSFDMLAEKSDGFSSQNVCITIACGGEKEVEANAIFTLANKAFDAGITNRLLIAVPGFSDKSKQLAAKQRIKVIDGDSLGNLLTARTRPQARIDLPIRFETAQDLCDSLVSRGYRVEQNGRVTGKSGVEHTFDILAHLEGEQPERTLAVDYLTGDEDVGLDRVAFFDTKAYDAGVDTKVIVVSPGLTTEAHQLAEHQRIRVLEWTPKPTPKPEPPPEAASGLAAAQARDKGPSGRGGKKAAAPPEADAKAQAPKTLRQLLQPDVIQLIPEVMARRYNAIPLSVSGNTMQVAMGDATDIFAIEAFSAQSKMRVTPVAFPSKDIREAIDFSYKGYGEIEKQVSSIFIPDETTDEGLAISATLDTPLTAALNMIIEEAVKARASDIHIEPEDDRLRVRYRIDGILQDMMSLPLSVRRSLISRIKILSDLNIADHQRPQDGQFTATPKGREIDVRVAIAPTVWGEMGVMRLLDKSMAVLELPQLGMMDEGLAKYRDMLKVPHGMILISGPTGAGRRPRSTLPSTPSTRWGGTSSPSKTRRSTGSRTSIRYRSIRRPGSPSRRGCVPYSALTLM
jgi:general secretion pathway protein E